MDGYGVTTEAVDPPTHLGRMSHRFSSVSSNGGSSANGEIYRSSNAHANSSKYYKGGYGAFKHQNMSNRNSSLGTCSIVDRQSQQSDRLLSTKNKSLLQSSQHRSSIPNLHEATSRATLQPKGLHTHVLNCSGLRPHQNKAIGHPLRGVFELGSSRSDFISGKGMCNANSLSIRDKVDLYPHVCGKDTIPQVLIAESSTSSDQDLPITRVHHYKKKMHKNQRTKANRRLRTCNNRNCSDKCCNNFTRDSEDSSVFSKSDSESKYSSSHSRVPKVSISTSTEILHEESSSFKFIPPSPENEIRPLKSALKISQPQLEKRYNNSGYSRKVVQKTSFPRHRDDNYRKSFVLKINDSHSHGYMRKPPSMFTSQHQQQLTYHDHNADNDTDVYDPSLPVIPIMIPSPKSNSGSVDSHLTKSYTSTKSGSSAANSRKSGSIASSIRSGSTDLEEGIRTIKKNNKNLYKNFNSGKALSKSMSNLSILASEPTSDLASEPLSDSMEDLTMVSPTLGNWHEALALTKMLGWTLILYHAVRNNYKPLQFALQLLKGSRSYVRAVADYQTRESRLLSFNKGDIIRVTSPDHYQDKGWLEGSVHGRSGLFPMEYVVPIGRGEARMAKTTEEEAHTLEARNGGRGDRTSGTTSGSDAGGGRVDRAAGGGRAGGASGDGGSDGESNSSWGHHHSVHHKNATNGGNLQHHQDDSGHSSGGEGGNGVITTGSNNHSGSLKTSHYHKDPHHETLTSQYSSQFANDGKHSLLQFALKYFRLSKEQNLVAADGTLQTNKDKSKKKKNSKDNGADWTWKEQLEMVKFSQSPIVSSLLPLEPEVSHAAVEVFLCVMRYMGDYPLEPGQTEVQCVYAILIHCHAYETLHDELYCQVMKQTTSNKSSIPDSCQRGWRLFSIVAAYFTCSDTLRPYLFKYLETNAYDKRRAFHGTAMVCLQNLRKTFKYGGRKNVPSVDEITALTAGRNSKREIYRLPGGTERIINTRSTSVVQDILEELCHEISVTTPEEQEEFSMYCLVEGEAFTMPLAREEYILDVTTELRKNNQEFFLIFCRSVWYCPMRLDTPLYVEVVFNQIAPDYLEGLLLVAPGEHLPKHLVMDIAKVAALMHRAADLDHEPTMREVKYLLPKHALVVRVVKPQQWINMVQGEWPEVAKLSTTQAKTAVLEILQHWDLFGTTFFPVKRLMEGQETEETILALNKRGVHFLDYRTHETLEHYSLSQVFSTRKVKSDDGYLYLDMKFGNLLHHRISRIQTIQAHEISRLFRQYISTEQRVTGGHDGDAPRDVTLSR